MHACWVVNNKVLEIQVNNYVANYVANINISTNMQKLSCKIDNKNNLTVSNFRVPVLSKQLSYKLCNNFKPSVVKHEKYTAKK
jgi:hypothetical protein